MTNFPFDDTIPAAPNNPSADQPIMLVNNASTKALLAVDHISFEANDGGTHLQTTFVDFASPAAASGTGSVGFPAAGTADAAHAQYFYKNPNATFPLSAIKAFGVFVPSGGAPAILNGYNIDSTSFTSAYNIVLNTNVVASTNVAIFVSSSSGEGINYSFAGSTLSITPPMNLGTVSFAILQI